MKLRPPQEKDIPTIYEVWRQEESSSSSCWNDLSLLDKARSITSIQKFFIAAYQGKTLLGWVTKIDREIENEINVGFYLLPEHRGKKLMSKILKKVVHTSGFRVGHKQITGSTSINNKSAIVTFETAGFREITNFSKDEIKFLLP